MVAPVAGDCVAKREGSIGGEFAHQTLGERLDHVVIVFLRLNGRATNGDDGSLHCGLGDAGFSAGFDRFSNTFRGRFVLGSNITSVDIERAIGVYTDEDTGAHDLAS
ncbi:hypothetical protein ACVW1A_000156 [Bradyrhizobium sp. LB1.3]